MWVGTLRRPLPRVEGSLGRRSRTRRYGPVGRTRAASGLEPPSVNWSCLNLAPFCDQNYCDWKNTRALPLDSSMYWRTLNVLFLVLKHQFSKSKIKFVKWQHVSLSKYEVKTKVKMKKVATRLFKNVQEICQMAALLSTKIRSIFRFVLGT